MPDNALLQKYRQQGAYTDCYSILLNKSVSLADYVLAFYTTPLFRSERFILKWAVNRPSTDEDAAALGAGTGEQFAAWTVEARSEDQLLLSDYMGRTRSWLMVSPEPQGSEAGTRLYFGSAVVPVAKAGTAERRMGFVFHALLGFHKLYSIGLLGSAHRRLGER